MRRFVRNFATKKLNSMFWNTPILSCVFILFNTEVV